MVKYSTMYFGAACLRENIEQLRQIYMHNVSPAAPFYYVLLKWSTFFVGLCKIICVLITFVGLFMLCRPLVIYLVTNEPDRILPVWVPGVDESTIRGFTLTTAYHVFVVFLAVMGTMGADTMFVIFVLYNLPMVDIFENLLHVINESAQISLDRDSVELRMYIRNLLQIHNEMCIYNMRTSSLYWYQCTVEVNTNGMSLCACVFCVLAVSIRYICIDNHTNRRRFTLTQSHRAVAMAARLLPGMSVLLETLVLLLDWYNC